MSQLNINTIQSISGGPVTLTQQSAAKAYQHHDEDLTTMHKSLNVTSSTDNGTGDFTANFTNSWSDARYMYSFGVDDNDFNDATAYTINSIFELNGKCMTDNIVH